MGFVCVLALFGCGKNLPKLTDDQKATLKGTLNGAASAVQAPTNAKNTSANLLLFNAEPVNKDSMSKKLRNELRGGNCIDESKNTRSSIPSAGISIPSIKLSGPKCPIAMEMAFNMGQTQLDFHLSYKVQSSDYLKLNDLDEMNLNFVAKPDGQNSGSATLTGKLHGQKLGNIGISGDFKMSDASSGTGTIRFEFDTFVAEFGMTGNGQDMKYTLNGEELTESQAKEYFGEVSKISKSEGNPAPTPSHSSSRNPSILNSEALNSEEF